MNRAHITAKELAAFAWLNNPASGFDHLQCNWAGGPDAYTVRTYNPFTAEHHYANGASVMEAIANAKGGSVAPLVEPFAITGAMLTCVECGCADNLVRPMSMQIKNAHQYTTQCLAALKRARDHLLTLYRATL